MDSKPMNIEDFNTVVPWKVYEKTVVLNEVREKRKDIIILVLIALLALTNAFWVYEWSKYEYVEGYQEINASQEGEGVNIVGGGDVDYGADSTDSSEA